ncbi:hypothetical protein HCH_00024 [Hahella chejuensis KCTC 2396]|uniref:Uncharacterized protein n=1 Tax=Hahella chejuensis (strain KCTC 2396) TaxID=349521 RepID=Q2SQX7_HAHCH|nr:hypothetical protein [Hahella chejuensis]ABC26947.1 hypothetical protein HCH_00024 [Hahella chejuensis KCTC 2396]
MDKLQRNILLSLCLSSLALGGCEQLGLEDDEKKDDSSPPVVVEPPDVIVEEPQEPFPVTKNLFFSGLQNPGEDTEKNFAFRYDITAGSVYRQSPSQPTSTLAPVIPLGKSRASAGYMLMIESGKLFLGRPDQSSLTQVSTLASTVCAAAVLPEGLGYGKTKITVRTPGADATCANGDDAYFKIPLNAAVTDAPGNGTSNDLNLTPFWKPNWALAGYLRPTATSLEILDAQGALTRSIDGLADADFIYAFTTGELDMLLTTDSQVFANSGAELLDTGMALSALTTIDANVMDPTKTVVDGDNVYLIDGTLVRRISLDGGANETLHDFSSEGAITGRLAQTTDYLVIALGGSRLYLVDKVTGESREIINPISGDYLTGASRIYANYQDVSNASAYLMNLDIAATACPGAHCAVTENARWLYFQTFKEVGVGYAPVLMTGEETPDPNPDDSVDSYVPAFENGYFNRPAFTSYNLSEGLPVLNLGRLNGQNKLIQTGVVEQTHGLFTMEKNPDNGDELADVIYFNLSLANSLKNISRSGSIDEKVLRESDLSQRSPLRTGNRF